MTDQGELHSEKPQYAKVPSKLIHDLRISPGAVRCYAHMHWRYGRNETNFEGRRSIAEMLGVSVRAVSGYIKELEAYSWIVVVERDNRPETGMFRTPYYHVFETTRSANKFRQTYKPKVNEHVRLLPTLKDKEKRKLRTGKGGKPTHKPVAAEQDAGTQVQSGTQVHDYMNSSSDGRENSSSRGIQENSSSRDAVNPSSLYPTVVKSSYPDVVKEQQLEPPKPKPEVISHRQNGLSADPQSGTSYPPPVSAPPLSQRPNAFALYEQNIGALTPVIKDEVTDLLKEFAPEWVEDAIKETALNGVKSIKYVRKIVERWGKEGRNATPPKRANARANNSSQPPPSAAAPGSTHGVGLPPSAFIKRQEKTP